MFRFNFFLGSICISLLFVALSYSLAFSTTLIIEDGQLMGATDVLILGETYDVRFADGSALDIYLGGDKTAYYVSPVDPEVASLALLNEVLLNGGTYLFDANPSLTSGIESTDVGYIWTPAEVGVTGVLPPLFPGEDSIAMIGVAAANDDGQRPNFVVAHGELYIGHDLSGDPYETYAVMDCK